MTLIATSLLPACLAYIGPTMGTTAFTLIVLVMGIVVAALGYIVWLRLKKIFKK